MAFAFASINLLNIAKHFALNKKTVIFISAVVLAANTLAQPVQFSICTDLGFQRSFKKEQRFWAAGHTTQCNFNINRKDVIYFLFGYFTEGKFKNNVTATAKSPLTTPQQIGYTNRATMRFKQFSLGWKKYLKGTFDAEEGWNLYGIAGLGLLFGRVDNNHSATIDTSLYDTPVYSGKAGFKRLTLDVGLGWEVPVGGDFFFYTEGKLWIPTTDYPSKFIFINDDAPLAAVLSAGIRILF